MLISLLSFVMAEEPKMIQIIGSGSPFHVRTVFVNMYSCGKVVSEEKGVVECYDLGKNYFATRSPLEDSCHVYIYR